jgi:hypothetical protein
MQKLQVIEHRDSKAIDFKDIEILGENIQQPAASTHHRQAMVCKSNDVPSTASIQTSTPT